MGYEIIFETKFVKMPDGKILHLELKGCNNDNAGRKRDEFIGNLYTVESVNQFIKPFETTPHINEPNYWELKIGNRYCQIDDYGKHLRTMLNRAVDWNQFVTERQVYAYVVDGILIKKSTSNNWKAISFREYDELKKKPDFKEEYRCKYNVIKATQPDEIIAMLNNYKMLVNFYVGRKYRKKS